MKPIRQLSVVPTLPENLEPLRELALNLWWTWNNEALSLFRHLDSELWEESYHDPVAMLGKISQEQLHAAAKNEVFLAHLDVIHKKFKAYLSASSWFDNYSDDKSLDNRDATHYLKVGASVS